MGAIPISTQENVTDEQTTETVDSPHNLFLRWQVHSKIIVCYLVDGFTSVIQLS
jgi:hypothetical protein